jgi:hypothetical protein
MKNEHDIDWYWRQLDRQNNDRTISERLISEVADEKRVLWYRYINISNCGVTSNVCVIFILLAIQHQSSFMFDSHHSFNNGNLILL